MRPDIDWRAVGWSIVLLLPATMVGVAVGSAIPERVLTATIAGFVLVVAWRPSLLKWRGGGELPARALVGVGAASGFLSATVGASGPVTSPFYRAATRSHKAFVATAAASQVFAHSSKLLAFSLDDFDPSDHLDVILVGAIGVSIGSWVGTRLMGRLHAQHLDRMFKIVLTALAVRLLLQVAGA